MKLPRLRYDRFAWVAFLLLVAVALFSAIGRKKNSFADGVEVAVTPLASGDKLISERDVRQALCIPSAIPSKVPNSLCWKWNVWSGSWKKTRLYWMRNICRPKMVLHVTIIQREPLVRILDNNGGNYYLDKNGVKMPASKNFAARVLVATGNLAPYTAEFRNKRKSTLKDLFNLTQTLMADEFLASFIQQVHVNNAGDFILVPLIGDQKIVLGSTRKLEDKLRRLKIFYQEGMPYEGWRKYETINLKYNGQVVCKKS
ncbi:MAG: hypothetical protein IPJ82_02085 [Lewinellaceae bacterium]|nr:hypothetical protein [Lewinellaceae bacterium]